MRVLAVPELYRPDDPTACGTLGDLITLAEEWLRLDDRLHLYWLLPPREHAGYDRGYVLADRERVTLIEAERYLADADPEGTYTENGYSAAQLRALRRAITDRDGYLDAVVDQLRTGRFVLSKWLLDDCDQWAAEVRPFDLIANVHDLQLPFKYRYCSYRDAFQSRLAAAGAAFADGVWFKAGADRRRMREYADGFLDSDLLDRALASAVETGSPIDLSGFDAEFADAPETFHVAGSFWAKKDADRLFDVGRRLHDEFGIRTLITSMEPVPDRYREPSWVDARGEASREAYERALAEGDLAVCASAYETMARTPFEQAASGQVVLFRDEPWVYDSAPDDYPLVGPPDALADLAVTAVEEWDAAVDAGRRLVEHVRRVRSPERAGERTHADLRRRVDRKRAVYDGGKRPDVVARTLAGADPPVALDAVAARTAAHTDDGRPLTADDDYARIDLVYTLRALGWADTATPGTPAFEPTADAERFGDERPDDPERDGRDGPAGPADPDDRGDRLRTGRPPAGGGSPVTTPGPGCDGRPGGETGGDGGDGPDPGLGGGPGGVR